MTKATYVLHPGRPVDAAADMKIAKTPLAGLPSVNDFDSVIDVVRPPGMRRLRVVNVTDLGSQLITSQG